MEPSLDLARRVALVARGLESQLKERLEPGLLGAQLLKLSQILEESLAGLPALASAHRIRLHRRLYTLLQRRLSAILETYADTADEAALSRMCLASEGFHSVLHELETELANGPAAAALEQTVGGTLDEQQESQPSSCGGSSVSDGDRMDDLLFGLDDELPPFAELGDLVYGLQCGDIACAWPRLQLCSAVDLLECDQWPAVPGALLAVLLSPLADEAVKQQCVALHAALYHEGAHPQRASVLINLAQFAVEQQPPLEVVRASSAWCDALQLLGHARAAIAAGTLPLAADVRDAVLYHACGLATLHAPPQLGIAHVLAAADPSARWLTRFLARGCWREGAWHHLCASGLLHAAAAAVAQPLPRVSTPSDGAALGGEPSDGSPAGLPSDDELTFAHVTHACCVAAAAITHLCSTAHTADAGAPADDVAPPGEAPSAAGGAVDAGWVASVLPQLLERLAELAASPVHAPQTPFVAAVHELALDALALALDRIALAPLAPSLPPAWDARCTAAAVAQLATVVNLLPFRATAHPSAATAAAPTAAPTAALFPAAADFAALMGSTRAASVAGNRSGCHAATALSAAVLAATVVLPPLATHLAAPSPHAAATRAALAADGAAIALLGVRRPIRASRPPHSQPTHCTFGFTCGPSQPSPALRPAPRQHCGLLLLPHLVASPALPSQEAALSLLTLSSAAATDPRMARQRPPPAAFAAPSRVGALCTVMIARLCADSSLAPMVLATLAPLLSATSSSAVAAVHAGSDDVSACRCAIESVVSVVTRACAASEGGAWLLPPCALGALTHALHTCCLGAPTHDGGGCGGDNDSGCGDDGSNGGGDVADMICACGVAGWAEGLLALSLSGAVGQCAAALVEAAQTGGELTLLHDSPQPGGAAHARATALLQEAPTWESKRRRAELPRRGAGSEAVVARRLCELSGLLCWPHAMPLALGSAVAGEAAEARAALRGAVDVVVGTLARGVAVCNESEAVAVGLLLLSLLCADPQAALMLEHEYALSKALLPLSDGGDGGDGGDGHAPLAPLIDLNGVCRARLLAQLSWGVPSEWFMPRHALALAAEHPFAPYWQLLQTASVGPEEEAAACGGAAVDDGACSTLETATDAEAGLHARLASVGSKRVLLALPLLVSGGLAPAVCRALRACDGHQPNTASVARPLLAADYLDSISADLAPNSSRSPRDVSVASTPSPVREAGARHFAAYVERVDGRRLSVADLLSLLAVAGELAAHREDEGAAALCPFDAFAALSFLLLGDGTAPFLQRLSTHPASRFLWPAMGAPHCSRAAPSGWRVLSSVAERVLASELPLVSEALRRAGVPPSLPFSRWLCSCWLNVLPWPSILSALALPLLLGADFQVYLCIAAMRSVAQSVLHCAHSADLLCVLLQPLPAFEPHAALPYMLHLHDRHGPLFERATLEEP